MLQKEATSSAQQALIDRLVVGSTLLKVSNSGKLSRRHVSLSADQLFVKWQPSAKKVDSQFVDLRTTQLFSAGKRGRRFDRVEDLERHADARDFFTHRAEFPVEVICGWLEKMGGANGGRKGWQRRWCVLAGAQLLYYASPADAAPKGTLVVTGSVATPGTDTDENCFSLSWGDSQPERQFRAPGRIQRDRWVEGVKRVLRVERSKASSGSKLRSASASASGAGGQAAAASVQEGAMAVRALGNPSSDSLCFSLGPVPSASSASSPTSGGAAGSGGAAPVSFIAGSMRDYDMWYTGLCVARDVAMGRTPQQRLEHYTAQTAAEPSDAVARVMLGAALEDCDRPDDALAAYTDAVIKEPRLASARKALGRSLLRNDPAGALAHLEIATALTDREDFEASTLLGRAHTMLGSHAAAVSVLEHALVLEPRSSSVHVFIATSLAALGRMDDAIKHLRSSLSSNPGQALVHAALGDLLTTQGRAMEAIECFNKALALDPSLTPVHEHVALALERLGRFREAVSHRERVLEADPSNVDHVLAAAQAYFMTEQSLTQRLSQALGGKEARSTSSASPPGHSGSARGAEKAVAGADGGDYDEGGGEDGGEDVEGGEEDGGEDGAGAGAGLTPTSGGLPSGGLTGADAPTPAIALPFGALALDRLSALELLTAAEAHLVRALTVSPESPTANILCAKVYERFAALEREALLRYGVPEGSSPDDEVYASGWTPHQRLDSARNFYEYVVAAYPQPEYVEASINLAQLHVAAGCLPDALVVLKEASSRAPDNRAVLDLLIRVQREAEGLPEAPPASARPRTAAPRSNGGGGGGELDMTGVDLSKIAVTPGMSEAERKHQYWIAMRAQRAAEAEEKRAQEAKRVAAMTEEERAAYDEDRRRVTQHEERQDRMLRSQLGAYGSASGASTRALGAARGGRGRGRGRGK